MTGKGPFAGANTSTAEPPRPLSFEILHHPPDYLDRVLEPRQLGGIELLEACRERLHAARPAAQEQRPSPGRGPDPPDAPVGSVGAARDQTLGFERLDESRHRRRTHLLGGGELA